MQHWLEGWNVAEAHQADWVPWGGSNGAARAKVLAIADDYYLALIEAEPGYAGDPHEHKYPEFLYVLRGSGSHPRRRDGRGMPTQPHPARCTRTSRRPTARPTC